MALEAVKLVRNCKWKVMYGWNSILGYAELTTMDAESTSVICAVEDGVVLAKILVPQIRDPLIVDSMRSTMLQAIDSANARSVIINLRDVNFMMSMVFLAFLAVRRRMGGGRVIFCELSPGIAEILSICRLIPAGNLTSAPFEVANTLQEAREKCGLL